MAETWELEITVVYHHEVHMEVHMVTWRCTWMALRQDRTVSSPLEGEAVDEVVDTTPCTELGALAE